MDGDDDIYPDDSASQVGAGSGSGSINEGESLRNERHTQESEAVIASRVRDNVKEYLEVADKLKRILVATRELRKRKTTLESNLIRDMAKLEVENLALNKGTLVAKHSLQKVPLTKSSIISLLSKNLEDQELVGNIVSILYDKRDRFEKVELSHRLKKE
jgi:hypothetical protein